MILLTTIWYLVITPIPSTAKVAPAYYKSFEVESAEFDNQADCQAYSTTALAAELAKKYPSDTPTGIGSCFQREKP